MKPRPQELAEPNRLQDTFLSATRGQPITMYLANGVRLQGSVISEDRHCLLLVRDGAMQLVYKHCVSTVVPSDAVALPTSLNSVAVPA